MIGEVRNKMDKFNWKGYEHISNKSKKIFEIIHPHLKIQDDTVWDDDITLLDRIELLVQEV